MEEGQDDLRYAAVWKSSPQFESLESHGLSPEEHLAKCQDMQSQGFRMGSVSTASINGKLVTASVWHHPTFSKTDIEKAKETLALRQATAAVAALRMGRGDIVWPLLKHSPDPRLRTLDHPSSSPPGNRPPSDCPMA